MRVRMRTVGLLVAVCVSSPTLVACREQPVPVATPVVGQCHVYDAAGANAPLEPTLAVSCTVPHTSETIAVPATAMPAPDPRGQWTDEQIQLAARGRCDASAHAKALGITVGRLATTRLAETFFVPTPAQARAGARWLRCDIVAYAHGSLVSTTERQADQIGAEGAFARCTDDPPASVDESERCESGSSTFAAVAAVRATSASRLRARCASEVRAVAEPTMTRLSWTSTPPSGGAPAGGEAFGVCWLRVVDWAVDPSGWPAERSASPSAPEDGAA